MNESLERLREEKDLRIKCKKITLLSRTNGWKESIEQWIRKKSRLFRRLNLKFKHF